MTLPEISLGEMRIANVRAELDRDMPCRFRLRVFWECPDSTAKSRFAGVPEQHWPGDSTLMFTYEIVTEFWSRLDVPARRKWIRSKIREALLHELDEWLEIDGEKFPSPHR